MERVALEQHSLPTSLQWLHRHTFPGKQRSDPFPVFLSWESSFPGMVETLLGSILPQLLRELTSALWREASGTQHSLCLAR